MNQKQIFTEYWKILDNFEDYMKDGFKQERLNTPQFKLDLNKRVSLDPQQCSACNLHELSSLRSSAGEAVTNTLLIVNRALSLSFVEQGKQFSQEEDETLTKWLDAIGLDIKKDCKIIPIVLCPVLAGDIISQENISSCSPYIKRIIDETKPKAILVLGKENGQYFSYKKDIPIYISFHPDDVLKNESLKRPVWEILKQIKEVVFGK